MVHYYGAGTVHTRCGCTGQGSISAVQIRRHEIDTVANNVRILKVDRSEPGRIHDSISYVEQYTADGGHRGVSSQWKERGVNNAVSIARRSTTGSTTIDTMGQF